MKNRNGDKSTWAVGGGLLAGTGVGFFFLQTSALAFVGSMLAGLGVGLLVAAILSRRNDSNT
jgi:Na+/melibiose symporter-like transporter